MKHTDKTYPFDFRVLLNSELRRRMTQNDRYSLRAFARDLEIDPSDLSKILNGKRRLGEKLARHFAKKLGFNEKIFELDQEDIEGVDYGQLSLDSFEVISDWYHYAILELVKLKDFQRDENYISEKLSISKEHASEAVERLLRIGLLEKIDGKLTDGTDGNSTTVHHEFTAPAFKNLQKGILNKAIEAMDEVDIKDRDQSSMTVASSKEKITQAKAMIKKFRRKITKFLEDSEDKDTVFNLAISLYPIIKERGDRK